MDPRLYRYAMSGDTNSLRKLVEEEEDQLDLTLQLTPQSNNALHIAAQHGHRDIAETLISLSPSLLFRSNSDGDLPLHVASREGHGSLVEVLINSLIHSNCDEVTDLESTSEAPPVVWQKRNLKGNTVLHEALRFRRAKVAVELLILDPRLADGLNHAGESLLYLACELQMMVVVESILSRLRSTYRTDGLNGRTPFHASAMKKHFGMSPTYTCTKPVNRRIGYTNIHRIWILIFIFGSLRIRIRYGFFLDNWHV
ncbi:hypothetical protein QJS04_geneDACA019091 [Acorus gramineus]|uniref:Uncharacterized protein n=1 Tax=Acorus gramineus TaxID=55184 RepID=A0AAV9A9L5_ACOGR|nr:hypothetical protein QJS04_geneDACA019091 [Acorus gramineus]